MGLATNQLLKLSVVRRTNMEKKELFYFCIAPSSKRDLLINVYLFIAFWTSDSDSCYSFNKGLMLEQIDISNTDKFLPSPLSCGDPYLARHTAQGAAE